LKHISHLTPELSFTPLSGHAVQIPGWAVGSTSDTYETKGKLQIVVVRAATRGSAQWDSSCLWLALIAGLQTKPRSQISNRHTEEGGPVVTELQRVTVQTGVIVDSQDPRGA